ANHDCHAERRTLELRQVHGGLGLCAERALFDVRYHADYFAWRLLKPDSGFLSQRFFVWPVATCEGFLDDDYPRRIFIILFIKGPAFEQRNTQIPKVLSRYHGVISRYSLLRRRNGTALNEKKGALLSSGERQT